VRGTIALRGDVRADEVERAARLARAHGFISALPAG
jgi:ABC-type multidrug transport system fused ATPase/permease subunit